MPLDKLPEKELRDVVKHANSWKIDLEMGMVGIDPGRLREQIQFAKRIGAILLKTTPERPDGQIPMRTEISNCLRAVVGELAKEKIGLAIDNSRIPAPGTQRTPRIYSQPLAGSGPRHGESPGPSPGMANLRPGIRPSHLESSDQGLCRATGQRTEWASRSKGCPVGKGQLNIAWIVESFAALRIEPSAILESWTPEQKTLQETIALEDAWAKQGVEYLRRFIPD